MSYDNHFELNKENEHELHLKFLHDEIFRLRSHSCNIPIAKHFVPTLK